MQYEVILLVIVGGLCTYYFLKTRQNTPKHLRQKATDFEELLKLKTKECNQWKGRFNSRNAGPTIEKGDIEGDVDLETVIPSLAQNYVQNAPTWLKPLLSNPDVVKYAVKLAKEHPDQAKQLLGKFIGKKISSDAVQPEVQGL